MRSWEWWKLSYRPIDPSNFGPLTCSISIGKLFKELLGMQVHGDLLTSKLVEASINQLERTRFQK
jgi:hypothetical protein